MKGCGGMRKIIKLSIFAIMFIFSAATIAISASAWYVSLIIVFYQYEDGSEAAPTYRVQEPEYGITYHIDSPYIEGYTPDQEYIECTYKGTEAFYVKYYENGYKLTINYIDEDGNILADPYSKVYSEISEYEIESPIIDGYIPDQEVVSGNIIAKVKHIGIDNYTSVISRDATKRVKEVVNLVLKELECYNGLVQLKSFDPFIVRQLKKVTNKYKIGLLVMKNSRSKKLNLLVNTGLIYKVPFDFLAVDKKMLDHKYYDKYILKCPLYVWTFKGLIEAETYLKDYPEIICICNDLN